MASERHGRWGKATQIPGFAALNQGGFAYLASVSCSSAGNCVADGSYAWPADFAGGVYEPFAASERNGHWGKAIEVPGILPADSTFCEPTGGPCVSGQTYSVSCAPAGTCAVGGWGNTATTSARPAFAAIYRNGRWTKATQIPGLDGSAVQSASCTPAGKCVAGGGDSWQMTTMAPGARRTPAADGRPSSGTTSAPGRAAARTHSADPTAAISSSRIGIDLAGSAAGRHRDDVSVRQQHIHRFTLRRSQAGSDPLQHLSNPGSGRGPRILFDGSFNTQSSFEG